MVNHPNRKLSQRQREALQEYANGYECPDYAEFSDRAGSALGWLNRERVITALQAKGLLDDDQKITEAGRAALANN
jgi:hypothetical protein